MSLPGEQRPVIHRELRIIPRISREHLQDRAQHSIIEGNLTLPTEIVVKNTNTLCSKLTAFAAARRSGRSSSRGKVPKRTPYNYHRPHGALDAQTPYERLLARKTSASVLPKS
jgi:hypothetical protein